MVLATTKGPYRMLEMMISIVMLTQIQVELTIFLLALQMETVFMMQVTLLERGQYQERSLMI